MSARARAGGGGGGGGGATYTNGTHAGTNTKHTRGHILGGKGIPTYHELLNSAYTDSHCVHLP